MTALSQRMVPFAGGVIVYELERKRVKNLNLRIRADGSVYVSANARVPLKTIDAFVGAKGAFIQEAQARFARERENVKAQKPAPRDDCLALFTQAVADLLPRLADYGVKMPMVKVRQMKSRWGSCGWKMGVVTLNARLYYAPRECLDYVALHELCHFVHPDHSAAFHALLDALMPDWRARKRQLDAWSAK